MIWLLVTHLHFTDPPEDIYVIADEPAVFVRQDACEAIAKARAQIGLECKQLTVTE